MVVKDLTWACDVPGDVRGQRADELVVIKDLTWAGPMMCQVTYEGSELVAVKITGDKNVPAGKVPRA